MNQITGRQVLRSFAYAPIYLLIIVLIVSVYPEASWRYDPTSTGGIVILALACIGVPSLAWLSTLKHGDDEEEPKGESPTGFRNPRFALVIVVAVFFTTKVIQPFPAAIIAAVAFLAVQAAVTTLVVGRLSPQDPEGRVAAE